MQNTKIEERKECGAPEYSRQVNQSGEEPQMNDANAKKRESEKRRYQSGIIEIGRGSKGSSNGDNREGKHELRKATKVHEGCAQTLAR